MTSNKPGVGLTVWYAAPRGDGSKIVTDKRGTVVDRTDSNGRLSYRVRWNDGSESDYTPANLSFDAPPA